MNQKIKKRKELLRQIERCSYFVKGSLNDYCASCNRAKCVCNTKTDKRSFRLTYKGTDQTTRVVYVPRTRVNELKKMLANYSQVKATLEKLLQLNIKDFKDSG